MSKERLRKEHSRRKGKAISRRSFLRLSTVLPIGAALAGVGGVALAVDRYRRNQAIEDKLAEYGRKEKELEEFLPRFEQGYAQFANSAKKAIVERILDSETRKSLFIPFEIAEINRQNSRRNGYTVKRMDLEKRWSLEGMSETTLGNPNFFLYELWEGEAGRVAAYKPLSRTMYLPRGYNPGNLLDNSIITHELVHVAQDTEDRVTLPRGVYEAFQTTKSASGREKTVDIYEASAHIEEIEIVNAMTSGQFHNLVMAKEEDLAKYRSLFNSQPEQDNATRSLIAIAYRYYTSPKTTPKAIGADFLNYIRDVHRRSGFEIYTRTREGYALVP